MGILVTALEGIWWSFVSVVFHISELFCYFHAETVIFRDEKFLEISTFPKILYSPILFPDFFLEANVKKSRSVSFIRLKKGAFLSFLLGKAL